MPKIKAIKLINTGIMQLAGNKTFLMKKAFKFACSFHNLVELI